MQNRAQEDPIRNIASGANSIGSKAPRSPVLIEHHPSHLNYSAVLSFHDSILLRNARAGELLINLMLKAKLIKRDISELSPIVTANGFQAVGMLIVQPQSEEPKMLKYMIFALQVENPRVTKVVINNDKNVPLASHGATQKGPTVSIWCNCPGCSVITVLTGEWEAAIILP
jgi:hypothetical protein